MSGSILSSYKAAAATHIGLLIDLSSDGEGQHDWQPDKDLRWKLSNACHAIFPGDTWAQSRRVNNRADFITWQPELW